ncbi:post-transcriptional regulator [Sulfoacidibacillus thermotolerans]|uniref:Uncharacterized protein n=1 Tax=Sulfoacidibacillus thermotolerans TaxID=1765684 RepID=A0A2U3DB71_SULT2|nr:post-transcriptional regulator [Sulfoacidibacillus thermotolerans]PWI58527.1 hypothetical protein BM613_03130 [Sulfoacidibacillus thermotolerans]
MVPSSNQEQAQKKTTKIFGVERKNPTPAFEESEPLAKEGEAVDSSATQFSTVNHELTEAQVFFEKRRIVFKGRRKDEPFPVQSEQISKSEVDIASDQNKDSNEDAQKEECSPSPIQESLMRKEHPIYAEVLRLQEQTKKQIIEVDKEEDAHDDFHPYDQKPSQDLQFLLENKVEEFHWLGYQEVTVDDLWDYFRFLGKKRPKSLHELVNAVMCLQPQAFMNYSLKRAYRSTTLEDIDLEGLL